jgi:hypothetical protein
MKASAKDPIVRVLYSDVLCGPCRVELNGDGALFVESTGQTESGRGRLLEEVNGEAGPRTAVLNKP